MQILKLFYSKLSFEHEFMTREGNIFFIISLFGPERFPQSEKSSPYRELLEATEGESSKRETFSILTSTSFNIQVPLFQNNLNPSGTDPDYGSARLFRTANAPWERLNQSWEFLKK